MTEEKTSAPDASLWHLKLRVLTYLGVGKCKTESEVTDPLQELGELYIALGNLLRAITPLVEGANEGPPVGRKDTMRDLWPWYRERGLHVLDVQRQTRPTEDPKHSEVMKSLSAILKHISAAACILLLACGCTTTDIDTPTWKLHRISFMQKLEIPKVTIGTNGATLEGYKNDGGSDGVAKIAGEVTKQAISAAKH